MRPRRGRGDQPAAPRGGQAAAPGGRDGAGAPRAAPYGGGPGSAGRRCRANADRAASITYVGRVPRSGGAGRRRTRRPYRIRRVVVGRANRAASIAAFGRISLTTIVTWLRVEVLTHLKGRLTPPASR